MFMVVCVCVCDSRIGQRAVRVCESQRERQRDRENVVCMSSRAKLKKRKEKEKGSEWVKNVNNMLFWGMGSSIDSCESYFFPSIPHLPHLLCVRSCVLAHIYSVCILYGLCVESPYINPSIESVWCAHIYVYVSTLFEQHADMHILS